MRFLRLTRFFVDRGLEAARERLMEDFLVDFLVGRENLAADFSGGAVAVFYTVRTSGDLTDWILPHYLRTPHSELEWGLQDGITGTGHMLI